MKDNIDTENKNRDPEARALTAGLRLLMALPPRSRQRVLQYWTDKVAEASEQSS